MELILWRHAEAEPGEPDLARRLTAKGRRQAAKAGAWLDRHLPGSCRILVSPAVRTVETAEALGRKFKLRDELGPERDANDLLDAAGWPDARDPVLVIGHQPTLGRVAAMLLAGQAQDWRIRKAGIWWIVREQSDTGDAEAGQAPAFLRAVIGPDLASR
ncbi:MAG: SixA phosphatase family protein [Burkholderiaceae bacterium]